MRPSRLPLIPLLLLLACSGADPLPSDAAAVTLLPVVKGEGDPIRLVETGESLCCLGDPLVTQQQIASLEVTKGELGVPEIHLLLTDKGAAVFADHAANHVGKRVAVKVGDEVRNAPLVLPELATDRLILTFRPPVGAAEAAEEMAARIRPGLGKATPTP